MGVDHVEAAPVPELHVDLPRPVLVVAGNDEATALARQLGRKIERPLLADRLDDAVAEGTAGELLDGADDALVVGHRDRLGGARGAADMEREGPPRPRDDPPPAFAREPRQDRAEKADADDRD